MRISKKAKIAKKELLKSVNGTSTVQTSKIIAVDESGECIILKNEGQVAGSPGFHCFEVRWRSGDVTAELLN